MTPAALEALHAVAMRGVGQAWSAQDFAQMLAMRNVALDARAEGFSLIRVAVDEAELLALAVAPERRRRGFGRALLTRAMSFAAERGAREMFLEVAEVNAPALRLYGACGFDVVGRRRNYYLINGARVAALICRRYIESVQR